MVVGYFLHLVAFINFKWCINLIIEETQHTQLKIFNDLKLPFFPPEH